MRRQGAGRWEEGCGGLQVRVARPNWRNRRREVESEKTPECRASQVDVSGVMLRRLGQS